MDRIIQIIPAPPNMFVKWKQTDNVEENEISHVVCLALKEVEDITLVSPMVAFESGEIEDAFEFSNYDGIVFQNYGGVTWLN